MKGLLASVCCVWALLALRPAQAAGAPRASARLDLAKGLGTEQCIDAHALVHAVEARLQRRAFREDLPATLRVHIVLQRQSDANWTAEITMRDGLGALLGRRSIVTAAAHCSALDDSLALVVALLVDAPPRPATPGVDHESESAAPAEGAGVTPATGGVNASSLPGAENGLSPARAESPLKEPESANRLPIRLPRDTPARRQPWRLDVSLEGSVALGILPGMAPGVELGVGAKPPTMLELRWFGGLFAEREERRPGGTSGARFRLTDFGLAVCPLEQEFGAIHWSGCAGQAVGWLRVVAFGFDQNTATNHLTYALLAWTGLTIPFVRSLSARLGVRAEVPLQRAIYTYGARDGGERGLFEMKPVTAVLDAGLLVQL